MSEELMPCVFCGHDGVRVIVVDEVTDAGAEEATVPLYAASCPYCGARGPMALSEGEAVEAWNRRAGSTCEQRRTRRVCHVESSHVEQEIGAYSYLEVELSCGHAFTWDDGTPPDYCPYCGAKVVDE